jgi:ArsR family transcriptional regulator
MERQVNERTFRPGKGESNFQSLLNNTEDANRICRMLANNTRLKILCFVASGEKSVNQIKTFTKQQQPTVSQQLARLRNDGLVGSRRDGKTVYYKLKYPGTRAILECLEGIVELGAEVPIYGGE